MNRIFLIGYMCSGKTTLGKLLAKELQADFIDMDWYIEQRFHCTVRDIFAERGEDGFRKIEQNILHEVGEFENVFIATGGGTPCFFGNMEWMNAHGDTVFLQTSEDTLFRRLQSGKQTRPILMNKTDEELRSFIVEALKARMPFYSQAKYCFIADELESHEQIMESVRRFRTMLNL